MNEVFLENGVLWDHQEDQDLVERLDLKDLMDFLDHQEKREIKGILDHQDWWEFLVNEVSQVHPEKREKGVLLVQWDQKDHQVDKVRGAHKVKLDHKDLLVSQQIEEILVHRVLLERLVPLEVLENEVLLVLKVYKDSLVLRDW